MTDANVLPLQRVAAEPMEVANRQPSIEDILRIAVEKNIDAESLTKLVDLHERLQARNAERALLDAMSAFQAECPSLYKNAEASFDTRSGGRASYRFATLDYIADTIRPMLQRHGLSYAFDSTVDGTKITVICRVSHIAGANKSASFTCPTGGTTLMSDMQKTASGLTYARRYALMLALGLTARGEDNDANGTTERITEEQAIQLEDMIESYKDKIDLPKFYAFAGATEVRGIAAKDFQKCFDALKAKGAKK